MPSSAQTHVEKLKAAILSADTIDKRLDAVEAVFRVEEWGLLPLNELEELLDYTEAIHG